MSAGASDGVEDGVRYVDAGASGDYVWRSVVSAGGSLSGDGCEVGAAAFKDSEELVPLPGKADSSSLRNENFDFSNSYPYFSLNSTNAPVVP